MRVHLNKRNVINLIAVIVFAVSAAALFIASFIIKKDQYVGQYKYVPDYESGDRMLSVYGEVITIISDSEPREAEYTVSVNPSGDAYKIELDIEWQNGDDRLDSTQTAIAAKSELSCVVLDLSDKSREAMTYVSGEEVTKAKLYFLNNSVVITDDREYGFGAVTLLKTDEGADITPIIRIICLAVMGLSGLIAALICGKNKKWVPPLVLAAAALLLIVVYNVNKMNSSTDTWYYDSDYSVIFAPPQSIIDKESFVHDRVILDMGTNYYTHSTYDKPDENTYMIGVSIINGMNSRNVYSGVLLAQPTDDPDLMHIYSSSDALMDYLVNGGSYGGSINGNVLKLNDYEGTGVGNSYELKDYSTHSEADYNWCLELLVVGIILAGGIISYFAAGNVAAVDFVKTGNIIAVIKNNLIYFIMVIICIVSIIILTTGSLCLRTGDKDYSGTYIYNSPQNIKYDALANSYYMDRVTYYLNGGNTYELQVERDGDDYRLQLLYSYYSEGVSENCSTDWISVGKDDIKEVEIPLSSRWEQNFSGLAGSAKLTFYKDSVSITRADDNELYNISYVLLKTPIETNNSAAAARIMGIILCTVSCAGMVILSVRRSRKRLIIPAAGGVIMLLLLTVIRPAKTDAFEGMYCGKVDGKVNLAMDELQQNYNTVNVPFTIYLDIARRTEDTYSAALSIVNDYNSYTVTTGCLEFEVDDNYLELVSTDNYSILSYLTDKEADHCHLEDNVLYLEISAALGQYNVLDEIDLKPYMMPLENSYNRYMEYIPGAALLVIMLIMVIAGAGKKELHIPIRRCAYTISDIVYISETYKDIEGWLRASVVGTRAVVNDDMFFVEEGVIGSPQYTLVNSQLGKGYCDISGIEAQTMYTPVDSTAAEKPDITYIITNGKKDYIIKLAQDMIVCVYGLEVTE